MYEEDIIRYCAPTLAGMKTGSLFACCYPCKALLRKEVRSLNRRLVGKGLRVLPLSFKNNRALLYFYRPDMLKQSLRDSLACRLLEQRGYPCGNPERCIIRLMEQLRDAPEFPHEIGLFLGYPPEDVKGFIEQRALHCKCTGWWKVYGDQKEAEQTFARYKKCTDCYLRNWQRGKSLEALTVSLSDKSSHDVFYFINQKGKVINMSKVAVVYWSGTGNTEMMANAVAEGAKKKGAEVEIFTPADFDSAKMDLYDAVAFGCPAMGAEVLEESEFQPMFDGCAAKLDGKKIALFGSWGWGGGEWMRNWEAQCREMGAVLACDSVICVNQPEEDTLGACMNLGAALA